MLILLGFGGWQHSVYCLLEVQFIKLGTMSTQSFQSIQVCYQISPLCIFTNVSYLSKQMKNLLIRACLLFCDINGGIKAQTLQEGWRGNEKVRIELPVEEESSVLQFLLLGYNTMTNKELGEERFHVGL